MAEGGTSSGATAPTLLKKTNSKSIIWNYFGFLANEEGKAVNDGKPICRRCLKAIPAKGGIRRTSSKHLKIRHPEQALELKRTQGQSEVSIILFVIYELASGLTICLLCQ